jgi:hypothetical protein
VGKADIIARTRSRTVFIITVILYSPAATALSVSSSPYTQSSTCAAVKPLQHQLGHRRIGLFLERRYACN